MKRWVDVSIRSQPMKSFKEHGQIWVYYKTSRGMYRVITPVSKEDRGPFNRLWHLKVYIKAFGADVSWQ